jgi:hypothetical protein
LNSYDYFEDVEKLNKKIDKHNKNIEFMENKKIEVQKALLDGTLLLPTSVP